MKPKKLKLKIPKPKKLTQGRRLVKPLYMDSSVVVVNKPAGIVSQLSKELMKTGSVDYVQVVRKRLDLTEDLWPAHRLDKVTTGALVLARTHKQLREISIQFRTHQVKKTYYALVRGGLEAFPAKSGVLKNVIKYLPDGRFDKVLPLGAETEAKNLGRMGVAETHWELIQTSPKAPLSLLKLDPVTGMKHQLRIHLAKVLRTPILGETVHANARCPRTISKVTYVPKNLFLHASHISFYRYRPSPHPNKRYSLGVTAPLNKTFVRVCRSFGLDLPKETITGGVFIDDEKVTEPALLPEGGKWILEKDTEDSNSKVDNTDS